MKNSDSNDLYRPHKKGTGIVVAVIFTVSASGFFMGLQQTLSTISLTREVQETPFVNETQTPALKTAESGTVPQAVGYAEMVHARHLKANGFWQQSLEKFSEPPEELLAVVLPSLGEKQEEMKQRLQIRAFDGAPPRIPHPMDQITDASCLSCHEKGMKMKDRYVPAMSHGTLANCTQCHVPMEGPPSKEAGVLKQPLDINDWEGIQSVVQGERAFPDAPPQIPHAVRMRSNCLSCHGPRSEPALRTTHPFRQNCLQCHLPSAELDRRGLLPGGL